MISKQERTELKTIVKQQYKVLRSELEQRQYELHEELETEIAEKFSDDDQQWAVVQHKVHEACMEANRQINDALYEGGYEARGSTERMWVQTPQMRKPAEKRNELRHLAASRITTQVKAAQLRLQREEADLLRTLAVGAIESEEARQFLAAIPTVGELVPASRLAEIEAQLTDDEDPDV